jgi:hypothetical protein
VQPDPNWGPEEMEDWITTHGTLVWAQSTEEFDSPAGNCYAHFYRWRGWYALATDLDIGLEPCRDRKRAVIFWEEVVLPNFPEAEED